MLLVKPSILGRDLSSPRQVEGERPRPSQLDLTVVVPTFNSADHIDACLLSVRRWLPDAEVVVVDNGSTDKTEEMVREAFPDAVLISGHGNVGFGRACNLGADRAAHEYVLCLNPDAELVSVDQDALVALMESRPLGIVGGTLIEDDGTVHPALWRRYSHWLTQLVAVHVLGVLSPYAPRTRFVERADARGAYTVSGSIVLVATDEFRSLGGFDERYFMYYEDADLAERYRQRDYPLRASPALLARHVGGASALTPLGLALSFLGWLEYTDKWHGNASATRAAAIARIVYSGLMFVLRPLANVTRNRRLQAKVEQLATMLSHIAMGAFDVDSSDPHERYPAAGPIARRQFRSFAPADPRPGLW